jgi:hypothetical protein
MQSRFPCPRCGSQNVIGQRFCTSCGETFQYNCAHCRGLIDPTSRFCTNCGAMLHFPTQQQSQPPTFPQHSQQQQRNYSYGQQPIRSPQEMSSFQQWQHIYEGERPKQKRTSPLLISCLGLIALVFIIGGALFALREPSSTTQTRPEYIQQQEPESSAQTRPEYIQQEPNSPTPIPPEYGQQYENRQPPVIGSHGNTVYLSNNPEAKDVDFAELESFILKDTTSEEFYLEGAADCVDFAEQVHNNAELAGIKAAFVCVSFEGEEIGHALNAFKTTDKGLVYIDCTGQGLKSISYTTIEGEKTWLHNKPTPGQYDKIAYIKKGMQLGVISIDKAESLDYSFYLQYAQNCLKLEGMIDDYNNEVNAFNQALGGRTLLEEPEYSQFKAWEAEIDGKKQTMLELADRLGPLFKPLGIVETVEIYW